MKADRDSLYQVINATSTVAISFLSLSLSGSQNRHTMQRKFGSQRETARYKIQPIQPKRFCYVRAIWKIKMLGQNTFEEPTRNKLGRRPITREGTSRLLVSCFSNYRRELILVFLLHEPDMSKHCHRPFSASHISLPVSIRG